MTNQTQNLKNAKLAKNEIRDLVEAKFQLDQKLNKNQINVKQTLECSLRLLNDKPIVHFSTNNQEVINYLDSSEVQNILNKYNTTFTLSEHPGPVYLWHLQQAS